MSSCGDAGLVEQANQPQQQTEDNSIRELREHSLEFSQRIEQVDAGVWVAIGFGLANSILIEGTDGLVVIDTMETLESGRAVATEFRKLSNKPLKSIIYTHNHTDHVFGAQAFIDILGHENSKVEVFAHDSTEYYVNRIISEFRPIISARSFRMFGVALEPGEVHNDGIGLSLNIDENSTFGFVKPTQTFEERLDVEVAGLSMQLWHAPGETQDQIFVYLPGKKMLALGDNLYKAFPNLYTIRGTPYRSLKQWTRSLDKMRALSVDFVVPSHGGPLKGSAFVHKTLTDYRDAIQFVHDQTVRYINLGLTPDEIVTRVKLPEHLRESPYLRELYGSVEFSVRSVFSGNLGWFDGNPATLRPLDPLTQAEQIKQLAGGFDALLAALERAHQDLQHQWALELSDHVLRLDPVNKKAMSIRVASLKALGRQSINPNARHYYLSSALELSDHVRFSPINNSSEALLKSLPLESLFQSLSVNLHAEKTLDITQKIGFTFTDTTETWTLFLRRGILQAQPALSKDLDLHVKVDSLIFKKLLAKQINGAGAIAKHFEFPVGNALGFIKFMGLFAPARDAPEPYPFAMLDLH